MQIETLETDVTPDELDASDEVRDHTLMTEFDAAAAALVAVRERVEALTQARADAEAELARCRTELESMRQERAADKAGLRELEGAVADERARLATARGRVEAVLAALDS
jgi:septal ring factor EnvC (AmiA/AmiB activator)